MSQLSSTDNAGVVDKGASFVTTSINHPYLQKTDAESIRVFLRKYDQYCKEVNARAKQLTSKEEGPSTLTTEAIRPVNLKFCVDPQYLDSAIALGFLTNCSSYDDLSDTVLRDYLDKKAEESKESVSLDLLDTIVERELRINMSDRNAKSRIENLFVSYHSILRRNGLAWLMTTNQKVCVYHVLTAIKPKTLHDRLESDLDFAHVNLKKDFRGFMHHSVKLSEAFQLVDAGPSHNSDRDGSLKKKKTKKRGGGSSSGGNDDTDSTKGGQTPKKPGRQFPLCLYDPCKQAGRRHLIKDCSHCSDELKSLLIKKLRDERARDGPAKSTRSQTAEKRSESYPIGQSSDGKSGKDKTVGRLDASDGKITPSCLMTFSDGIASITGNGRCDDGSDESIVSPRLAESAALKGIGKITAIRPVTLNVALTKGGEKHSFTLSRSWTSPRTVLHLAAGRIALINVTYLIPDDDLTSEEILIGEPVLKHLQVDTRTLLENSIEKLDGTDCSHIQPIADRGGQLARLMSARLNRAPNGEDDENSTQKEGRPRVNYFQARLEEDPFPDPCLLDTVDEGQSEAVKKAVTDMLKRASDNGLPPSQLKKLNAMFQKHMDVFRVSFSAGPPAKVRPLRIELTPDAKPVRVRLRKYSQSQREFLKKLVNELLRCGIIYPNPTAKWACAPLLVPKPGSAMFRFTVDIRPVNKYTVRISFPMPNVDNELSTVSGSRFFAEFDLSHGYWQFGIQESCQELMTFITPDGIFTSTRVLHGTTNATQYLQSVLSEIIPERLKNVLFWLDDILIHHETIDGLIDTVTEIIIICEQHNIKLHPEKCIMFAKKIRWCGRLISEYGVKLDPRRMEGLLDMEEPTTGAHLQQFLCAMQWLRNGIPEFNKLVEPLHMSMERVYLRAGKRTKRAVACVNLSDNGWSASERTAFEACKHALRHQVTLCHRGNSKRLCVYTDASDEFWSGIITQIPPDDIKKIHNDQRHEPLAFLSGRFDNTQMGWSVLEKEAFAVMATTDRMHWLLATPDGFDLFTDHNNLIFIFDPLSVMPDLTQTSLRKVLRWAVRLSSYNYTCFHIKGVENVWADLLGRWSAPRTVRRLISIPELPSSSAEDFEWPSPMEINTAQTESESSRPKNLTKVDGLWKNPNNAIWIPDGNSDLQLRLCVIAHTGPGGHRGRDTTERMLRDCFFGLQCPLTSGPLSEPVFIANPPLEGRGYLVHLDQPYTEQSRTTYYNSIISMSDRVRRVSIF